jgi:hypothetical protein
MTLRERAAGTGLQVSLERDRAAFVREFDDARGQPSREGGLANRSSRKIAGERRLVDQTGIEPVTS